ncbi:hypothetical protein TYRP_008617 [Tyrophagus putrescentiae]|nr:hypothetical protein TYRP_008617 [Tyrophagus putrescentiae]
MPPSYDTDVVTVRSPLKGLGPRSLRSRGPRRRAFLVSQVTPDLAVFICALLTYIHVYIHVLLLGPRSLRSRDPRRRSLTTAKSRQTSPPWAVHCCPRNNCAPPAAQAGNSENGENDSESTQPEPPAVQLLQ